MSRRSGRFGAAVFVGVAVLIGFGTVGFGCGDSDDSDPDDEIADLVERYETALSDKDAETICNDLVAPATFTNDFSRNDCEEQFGEDLNEQISEPVEIDVESIEVNGTRATAAVNGSPEPLTFREEAGTWYVDYRNPR